MYYYIYINVYVCPAGCTTQMKFNSTELYNIEWIEKFYEITRLI